MNIQLKAYTQASITNLFFDQQAHKDAGINLLFATFDVDETDPFGLYQIYIPRVESIYNYLGFFEPKVTALLEKAWRTYEPVQRAKYTAAAERILMDRMPMIPLISPNVVTYMNERITGAPTTFSIYWSAWANQIGAASGQ